MGRIFVLKLPFLKERSVSPFYHIAQVMEGNDVASGLSWALLSNSVVLMLKPTIETWLMQGKLVPWVHFIPIEDPDGIPSFHARVDTRDDSVSSSRLFN